MTPNWFISLVESDPPIIRDSHPYLDGSAILVFGLIASLVRTDIDLMEIYWSALNRH